VLRNQTGLASDAPLIFRHRAGSWDLLERARVAGILNLTPDSFYDGGRWLDPARALARAQAMAAEGADAIDVGAQSTRPGGGPPLGAEEEWARLRPVLPGVVRLGLPVSVDTWSAEVARRALDEGVAIVNDVTGLTAQPELAAVVASSGAGLVLMHALGAPDRMHEPVDYEDEVLDVRRFLERQMKVATSAGIAEERIALDPGIGFSKRAPQSLRVLQGLRSLTSLGRPLYIGVSRKSFLGRVTARSIPVEDRLAAGLGATVAALALGARIVRTHDVRETVDAIRTAEAILNPAARLAEDAPAGGAPVQAQARS
ncbi:MAG TPA: dihydropteroate synthase, partial [Candidatus Omnitrophota bacterium]|nr:dihydropteroate synthase [Candidatus Omnitrophota bacterium]